MNVTEVLSRAKEIAATQGRLANSPADREQGRITLCAGSCIAKSMIETNLDHHFIPDFERLLMTDDKFSVIPYVFERYGFDPEKAREVIKENDKKTEPERSAWFRSLSCL